MLLLLTITSMLVALVMSAVAWRASSEERRRSDARVAALATAIHATVDLDLRRPVHAVAADAGVATGQDLFTPASSAKTAGSRWGIALAAGGLVMATVAAAAIVFSSDTPAVSTASAPAAAAATAPLELVALAHERDGDSLTVRGVVRNPPSGTEMDRLVAVVFLFDRDGGFITSGRAALESSALIPGGESTFVVTVPATAEVGRYRVSFRTDDRVISHVDKRNRS
jgi:hypothetical protein